jgi:hypothetical protein
MQLAISKASVGNQSAMRAFGITPAAPDVNSAPRGVW